MAIVHHPCDMLLHLHDYLCPSIVPFDLINAPSYSHGAAEPCEQRTVTCDFCTPHTWTDEFIRVVVGYCCGVLWFVDCGLCVVSVEMSSGTISCCSLRVFIK